MFKRHWEKYPKMCDCLVLFRMYFIMWSLFLLWSECSLWRCSCWPIAKSCMIPFICKFIGFNFSLMSSARFLSFWIGVLISRLGTSEVSAICFSDWFRISSYYLSEYLIVVIALSETSCVSSEICYLSSVWNNAYERLCRKLFLVSQIGSFVNNFELGGSLLAFYDCCYVFHYEVGFLFYSSDYSDFEVWDLWFSIIIPFDF